MSWHCKSSLVIMGRRSFSEVVAYKKGLRILLGLVVISAIAFIVYTWTTPRQSVVLQQWTILWNEDQEELNGPDMSLSDPRVIRKIREKYLVPPSMLPYNLTNPEKIHNSQFDQSRVIAELIGNKSNGFFIEAGAFTGEELTNTLYFERQLGWNGLLVEADPSLYAELATKNRKAWSTCSCLSLQKYPTKVSFEQKRELGQISNQQAGYKAEGFVDVQCFPFYSYMLALEQTRVDYFSLDVEGVELEVLQTIPFDKIHISVLTVEFTHGKEDKQVMKDYMESHGYYTHMILGEDFIFIRNGTTFS